MAKKDCIELDVFGPSIKLHKDNTSAIDTEKGKKPYKFDTTKITPRMMYDVFTGTSTKGQENAIKQIKDVVDNSNAMNKIIGVRNIPGNKNILFDGLTTAGMDTQAKHDAGIKMQSRGIVMKHLFSTIKSEQDVENNIKLDAEEKAKLFVGDVRDGSRAVPTIGMATAIGRDLARAHGFKLSMDAASNNALYNKIGMDAIKEFGSKGGKDKSKIIGWDENAWIINNDYQASPVKAKSANAKLLGNQPVVWINYDVFSKELDAGSKVVNGVNDQRATLTKALNRGASIDLMSRKLGYMDTIGTVQATAKFVNRMSVPTNESVPTGTKQSVSSKDITMSSRTKETLKRMQDKKTFVNPKFGQFFLHLNNQVKQARETDSENKVTSDFETILKKEAGADLDMLTKLFGTMDVDEPIEARAKAVGQSLSKTSTLQVMIENADLFFNEDGSPKDLYFSHEMYRTGRVGQLETVLNAQTDKFFSRFALTGGDYEVKVNSKEWKHLINSIADDSGLSTNDVLGRTNNPKLDLLLDGYKAAFVDNKNDSQEEQFNAQLDLMKVMSEGTGRVADLDGSVWQQLASLGGINDIRSGKNKIIKTNFQTKPDATGSGIVLQLFQMLGLKGGEKAGEKLEQLGLKKSDIESKDFLKDVYKFLQNELDKSQNKKGLVPEKEQKANDLINDIVDGFGFIKNFRDIVKPTTMITSYMAGKKSVISESAEAYTDSIWKKLNTTKEQIKHGDSGQIATDFVLDMIEENSPEFYASNFTKNDGSRKTVSNKQLVNTEGARDVTKAYLEGTVGNHMNNLIHKALKDKVTELFQKKIGNVYEQMENILEENIRQIEAGIIPASEAIELRVLPAQVVMDIKDDPTHKDFAGKSHKELLDKFGMKIMSSSQIMEEYNGEDVLVMKESTNQLTALVNVIHSSDSAILHRAHRETMDEIENILRTNKEDGKEINAFRRRQLDMIQDMASKGIHDANNGNAVYNSIYQDKYRESELDVVGEYNMYEQMLLSYETIMNLNDAGGITEAAFKAMNEEASKAKAYKQKLIADGDIDTGSERIFGFNNNLEADTVIEPEVVPEVEAEVDTDPNAYKGEFGFDDTQSDRVNKMSQKDIDSAALYWADKSPVIKKFIDSVRDGIFKPGSKLAYFPGSNTITVPGNVDLKTDKMIYGIEHEIAHQKSEAYMKANPKNMFVKEIDTAVNDIGSYRKALLNATKDNEFLNSRLEYAMRPRNKNIMRAELVAVLGSEKAVADRFIKEMEIENGKRSNEATAARRLLNAVRSIYKKITGRGSDKYIDPQALKEAIDNVIETGGRFNVAEPAKADKARAEIDGSLEFADAPVKKKSKGDPRSEINRILGYKPYTPADPDKYKTPFVDDAANMLNKSSVDIMGNMVFNAEHGNAAGRAIVNADEYLTNNFPIYANNRNRIMEYWDQDAFVSGIKGFLNPARFGDRKMMRQLLTLQQKVVEARGTMDSTLIADMDRLMEDMSEKQIEGIYHATSQSPSFHLMNEFYDWDDLVAGRKTVDDLINQYEGVLNSKEKYVAKRLADMLTDDNYIAQKDDLYNSQQSAAGETRRIDFKKLVALYSIKNDKNYDKTFKILRENEELSNKIIDASRGMKDLHDSVFKDSGDIRRYRENLVYDTFDEYYETVAVNNVELARNMYPESEGWMVLREPDAKEYGIVYRKTNDETFQDGAGTTVSHRNSDVLVSSETMHTRATNYINTDVGITKKEKVKVGTGIDVSAEKTMNRQKLILTRAEKKKLGLMKNPSDALYRTYSRILEISSTQAARDLLLTDAVTETAHTKKALEAFDKDLGDMNIEDIKWLLKLPDGVTVQQALAGEKSKKSGLTTYTYPNIAKHFRAVEGATNVGGFQSNLDLVRKDVSPWLFGYKDPVLFEKSPKLRRAAYAVRQLVKLAKINWVITNPVKIAKDAISNGAILIGYGVPPAKMLAYGKDITKGLKSLEKLRIDHLNAQIHGNDKLAAKLDKKIKTHDLSIMINNGMMQSMNIELLQRDNKVVTGLTSDIESLLNNVLKTDDGKSTGISNAIRAFSNSGFGIDGILRFVGESAQNFKKLEDFGKAIEEAGLNIKNSADQDNIAKHVSEYLMTPGSQAVNLGSYMVQLTDVVPRGILMRHLMDNGKTEEEAINTVTDAFIDYKQNMPKELKVASDYGVLLFPSFWMRIQRVMYSLATKKPATIAAAIAAEEMMNFDIPTIFDANLISKMTGYGDVVDTPPILGFFQ